jgi:hypothetical protein
MHGAYVYGGMIAHLELMCYIKYGLVVALGCDLMNYVRHNNRMSRHED